VAIHDAARPFVSAELIAAVIRAAKSCGAAAPAVPVVDTVKTVDGAEFITGTPDRASLRAVSTPQVFLASRYAALSAGETDLYDDCQLFEKAGCPVLLVPGEAANFKITTPEDIARAKMQIGAEDYRIGHGYDVHRLVEGRKLIIGGVEIPFEKGLLGHSDADVLLHAVSDALLGAVALGDIGHYFPDTSDEWEGADSRVILRECVRLVAEAGFRPVNVDVTVLCQRPKLAPHIPAMRRNLAEDLGIAEDRVSVKATTEEGLGFTGEGLGIACHAVTFVKGA
jgi:2-C-methyl-D-erythritol 2,4-cyclodiphosphate synthase